MNKKGYSISGWWEGILLVLLFIGVFGSVISGMNIHYGKGYQVGLGEQVNATQSSFIDYTDSASGEIIGGEAEFTVSEGLTLKSTWNILKSVFSVISDFITGGFIETICNWMHLGVEVAITFRVLYFASLIFAVISVLSRRNL